MQKNSWQKFENCACKTSRQEGQSRVSRQMQLGTGYLISRLWHSELECLAGRTCQLMWRVCRGLLTAVYEVLGYVTSRDSWSFQQWSNNNRIIAYQRPSHTEKTSSKICVNTTFMNLQSNESPKSSRLALRAVECNLSVFTFNLDGFEIFVVFSLTLL